MFQVYNEQLESFIRKRKVYTYIHIYMYDVHVYTKHEVSFYHQTEKRNYNQT